MNYPYLGKIEINGKNVVIMFTDENEGTVVLNESGDDKFRFGMHDEFNEDLFEFLSPEEVVRIGN